MQPREARTTSKRIFSFATTLAVLFAATSLTAPRAAYAAVIEIDFSEFLGAASKGGRISPHLDATPGRPVVVDAYYKNAFGTYVQDQNTFLFVRNDGANDQGLGVCSPGELSVTSACGGGTFNGGGGDWNELSNESKPELIRLTLASGFWESVFVSSLDTHEAGQLWGSNADELNGGLGDLLWSFSSDDYSDENVEFALTGNDAHLQYLYFIPGPTGSDNDYLVWKVRVDPVPEPGTIMLVGIALAGLGFARRRKPH